LDFYEKLQKTIDETPSKDILVLVDDFNAKLEQFGDGKVKGTHGLGMRNKAGDNLHEFCASNGLAVMNTWFQQPHRKKYTLTSPDGKHRSQIDYI